MPSNSENECAICGKSAGEIELKRCAGCHARKYCGAACQRADWPAHKVECKAKARWHDKHRKCDDGGRHEGRLELITWSLPDSDVGWGNCFKEESDDLKRQFEIEYGGDEEKFYGWWPQGFRWTCCGNEGDNTFGCDHHGTGKKPCSCDFCRAGRALPDKIYNEKTPARHGLQLARGPDTRSFNPVHAAISSVARPMLGMNEWED